MKAQGEKLPSPAMSSYSSSLMPRKGTAGEAANYHLLWAPCESQNRAFLLPAEVGRVLLVGSPQRISRGQWHPLLEGVGGSRRAEKPSVLGGWGPRSPAAPFQGHRWTWRANVSTRPL